MISSGTGFSRTTDLPRPRRGRRRRRRQLSARRRGRQGDGGRDRGAGPVRPRLQGRRGFPTRTAPETGGDPLPGWVVDGTSTYRTCRTGTFSPMPCPLRYVSRRSTWESIRGCPRRGPAAGGRFRAGSRRGYRCGRESPGAPSPGWRPGGRRASPSRTAAGPGPPARSAGSAR